MGFLFSKIFCKKFFLQYTFQNFFLWFIFLEEHLIRLILGTRQLFVRYCIIKNPIKSSLFRLLSVMIKPIMWATNIASKCLNYLWKNCVMSVWFWMIFFWKIGTVRWLLVMSINMHAKNMCQIWCTFLVWIR